MRAEGIRAMLSTKRPIAVAPLATTAAGRAVPGLLLRHPLMARHTERPDVGHRALAATLGDWHDVVGIPVGAAAKEPPIALPELGTFSPLLLGPGLLDPSPFRVENSAQHRGIDATECADTLVAAKDALAHQRRAVSGCPVIDATLTAEGPASFRHLGAAGAAQRSTIWTPRKLPGLDPSVPRADPGGAHAGSHLLVFMMRILAAASGKELA